ncbi:hypothetical protein [Desemzia sp. FAM 23991]|uniref:hypothetical protein n=1 Tax=unclassified Desemzia TaxID=2685243 RepID=UPI00388AC237
MREIILILSEMMNRIHDVLMYGIGIDMSDKELHFWVIGFIGLITFLAVFVLAKIIQKLKFSTTILSFIFTFVVMTVFVFAIEIQQAVTNSGNMEFADAIAGLWGFVVFFAVYAVIAGIFYNAFRLVRKKKRKAKPIKNSNYTGKQKKVSDPDIVEEWSEASSEPAQTVKYRTEARKQREQSRE